MLVYFYIKQKVVVKKVKAYHILNGLSVSCNDFRVAMLPKSYLTVIGIIIKSLKSIGQS